jgi:hypothetical protein
MRALLSLALALTFPATVFVQTSVGDIAPSLDTGRVHTIPALALPTIADVARCRRNKCHISQRHDLTLDNSNVCNRPKRATGGN